MRCRGYSVSARVGCASPALAVSGSVTASRKPGAHAMARLRVPAGVVMTPSWHGCWTRSSETISLVSGTAAKYYSKIFQLTVNSTTNPTGQNMPKADDGRGNPGLPEHPLVEQLKPDPNQPAKRVVVLVGLPGNSDRSGFQRLYLSLKLDYYAEFLDSDIVSTETVPAAESPFPGHDATRVSIAREATIYYVRVRSPQPVDEWDLDVRLGAPEPAAAPAAGTDTCHTFCGPGVCHTLQTQCQQDTCHTLCQTACGQATCCGTCATQCANTQCQQFTCQTCAGLNTCGPTCVV
jgi:hypothetical protein